MVLMDCEGIDAFDQTADYSTQIFSLGVLLSSLLVFNQIGSIDESAIDKLSSVAEFAKLIKSRSESAGAAGLSAFSPAFLWLLRDFSLRIQGTPKEYLEEALAEVSGPSDAIRAKNQMRGSIKALFPDRDCFTLVRPISNEDKLAVMDTLSGNELRPEFKQGMELLVEMLLRRAHPKQYGSSFLTGPGLGGLVQAYVDVINRGDVPAISTTWQGVVHNECGRAVDVGLQAFMSALDPKVAAEEAALEAEHRRALDAALGAFEAAALGESADQAPFLKRLREQCGARFSELRNRRLAEAEAALAEMLAFATSQFNELVYQRQVSMEQLVGELKSFMMRYEQQAAGPNKMKRLVEWLGGCLVKCLQHMSAGLQAKLAEANARVDKAQQEMQQAKAAYEQRVKEQDARLAAKEAELARERQAVTKAHAELAAERTAVAKAQAELAEQRGATSKTQNDLMAERQAVAKAQAELSQAKLELSRLRDEGVLLDDERRSLQDQLRKMEVEVSKMQIESRHMAARSSSLEADLKAANDKVARLEDQQRQLQSEAARVGASSSSFESECKRLREQLQAVEGQRMNAESELTRLRSSAAGSDVELRGLRSKVAALEAEVAAAQQAAAALQREMGGSMTAKEQELSLLRQQQARGHEELSSQLAAAQAARSSAEEELRRVREQLHVAESSGGALHSQLSEARQQLDGVRMQLECVMRERDEAASRLGAQQQHVAAEGVALAAKESELAQLRLELAHGKAAFLTLQQERDALAASAASPHAGAAAAAPPPSTSKRSRLQDGPGDTDMADAQDDVGPSTKRAKVTARRSMAAATPVAPAAGADSGDDDLDAGTTPFSNERLVRNSDTFSPTAGAGQPAAAEGPDLTLPVNLKSMTVNDLKRWLSERGFEGDVWRLTQAKAKKDDFLSLVKEKCQR